MIPSFLRSEVLPYASVEIVRAPASETSRTSRTPVGVCAWCPTFDRTAPAVSVSHTICAGCAARLEADAERAAFRAFLEDPGTAARLEGLLAEFAAIDADQLEADAAARAREDRDDDERSGSTCGGNCGFCGRCS